MSKKELEVEERGERDKMRGNEQEARCFTKKRFRVDISVRCSRIRERSPPPAFLSMSLLRKGETETSCRLAEDLSDYFAVYVGKAILTALKLEG
tara:strand:+ start:805 stop:1086 length:282 start_codon:yes stop_codon:yes gene_type:complete